MRKKFTPEERRNRKNIYQRKWRAKHPGYERDWSRKEREKNPEKVRERARKWKKEHPEEIRGERMRQWRAANPEKVLRAKLERRKPPRVLLTLEEKRKRANLRRKKWAVANPEKILAQKERKRLRLMSDQVLVEKIRKKARDKYWENPELGRKRSTTWKLKNPDKKKENDLRWRKANPDRVRENNQKYTLSGKRLEKYKNDPEKFRKRSRECVKPETIKAKKIRELIGRRLIKKLGLKIDEKTLRVVALRLAKQATETRNANDSKRT